MNASTAPFVRLACTALLAMGSMQLFAQHDKGSLTDAFSKLSPKERSRIAEKETREAAADSNYQTVMRQADLAFQQDRYQDALAAFQQARTLRPYNVYPKVKIQDLQALIKKKEEEAAKAAPVVATPPPVPTMQADPASSPASVLAQPAEVAPPPPAIPASTPPPATAPPPPVRTALPASSPAVAPKLEQAEPQTKAPAQLGERVYKEAGAVVTERTVEDEGRPVIYKKVVHPWGQTFHFKDGLTIPAREWKARFSE